MHADDVDDVPATDPLVDSLVQNAFTVMAVLNRIGAEHELSLTQLRVLAILRDRRLTMTVLANHLGLEKSTMTGLVARAETRGLLRREPNDADARSVDVVISRAGARLVDRSYPEVASALAAMTSRLGSAERDRLSVLLDRLTHVDDDRGAATRRRVTGK